MNNRNIYEDGELDEDSTCKKFLQVQTEAARQIGFVLMLKMK